MDTEKALADLRNAHSIQGTDGNWNHDPYMRGMYNGLEFALALFEGRDTKYKDAPETEIAKCDMCGIRFFDDNGKGYIKPDGCFCPHCFQDDEPAVQAEPVEAAAV